MALALATGFGLGLSPLAPGTVATILGFLPAAAMAALPWPAQLALSLILALAAVALCGRAEQHYGAKDDHRIVADEFATLPLALIGLPWPAHPWLLGVAFVTHRAMDVLKPPPARQAQSLPGGWGIVADDVISSLYALAINHGIARWIVG